MGSLLVTGGAGFIGANFVRHWREHYPQDRILVLDALTYAGNPENLASVPDVDLVKGDICDDVLVRRLLLEHDCDTIVHFAAESHVDRSITDPAAFVRTNVNGTHTLLEAAREIWGKSGREHRFHHVSTDEVYGTLDFDDPAFSETTAYAPNSPYSASKAGSDHLVRAYSRTYGLQTTTTNCSNNYGPFQYPEKLIPLFLINCLYGRQLPIYGDGRNVRDWLHVADHCRGIELALKRGKPGETYNIGGGEEVENLRIVDEICQAVDEEFMGDPALAARFPDAPAAKGQSSSTLRHFVTDRPGHDRRYAIDDAKARAELDYAPQRDFTGGFRDTLRWYLANEAWWLPLYRPKNV